MVNNTERFWAPVPESREECHAELRDLQVALGAVKVQLEESNGRRGPEWEKKATSTAKSLGVRMVLVQQRLAALNRADRETNLSSLNGMFMDKVRLVDQELYFSILDDIYTNHPELRNCGPAI